MCRKAVPDGGGGRTEAARPVTLPHRSRYDEIAAISRSQVRTSSDSRHWSASVLKVGGTNAPDAVEGHQRDLVLNALFDG